MSFEKGGFEKLLKFAVSKGASDIHMSTGEVPALRINGYLVDIKCPPLNISNLYHVVRSVSTVDHHKERPDSASDVDGSFEVPGLCRFRYNIYSDARGLGVVFRTIPNEVPRIESLKLPTVLSSIALSERGLVLVTGTTGSGKTTTLAALLNHINENRRYHILSIEDPVEFIHSKKKSRFTQREVGKNTYSFATALKSALRQDPDVIFVGELRDVETADIAIKAAETGKLIFTTAHTTDARQTISRLVSMFPGDQQDEVRMRLSRSIRAIVSQRLVRKAGGKGRVPAIEVMINHGAIQECIADPKKIGDLNIFIENGKEDLGSQTFDQHLADLLQSKLIDPISALAAATNPKDFARNLRFQEAYSSPVITLDRQEDRFSGAIEAPSEKTDSKEGKDAA